jgi:hypothetical protein
MDWSTIGTIAAALIGAIAGGFVIKKVVSQRKDVRIVSQKSNTAGGDIVAGDSTKTTSKH